MADGRAPECPDQGHPCGLRAALVAFGLLGLARVGAPCLESQ